MKQLRSILYYEPMEGSRLCLALHWLIQLVFLGVWSLALGVAGLYFGAVHYGPELFASYFPYALLLALNVLPAFVLALALLLYEAYPMTSILTVCYVLFSTAGTGIVAVVFWRKRRYLTP